MSRAAIEVSALSKRYVIEHESRHDNLRDTLHHSARKLWRRVRWGTGFEREEFWALRDVSFSIQPGEVVGVIGRNGAGKSTLLKILSRITEPSSGKIAIRGRVASLLEVGTGFHPDLTGRENIFLNGAILGMSRAEIRQKFDEIVAFAEIERFLDTPVKRYSSGMYVRLAFAVAAHLEPEILIVDEVLAVGDAQFQKKCIGKMREIASGQGRAVLFVSHDLAAISSLTSRCLLLQSGTLAESGPTAEVLGAYYRTAAASPSYDAPPAASASFAPAIESIRVNTSLPGAVQSAGDPLEIEFTLRHAEAVPGACLSFQIVNHYQQPATHIWHYSGATQICAKAGPTRLVCRIPRTRLNVGSYKLRVFFSEPPGGRVFDTLDGVCPFQVTRLDQSVLWGWRPEACVYHEDFSWSTHSP